MGLILDILQEHLEEAAYLFARHRAAVRSPLEDMRRLADLDERLDAHLDGLSAAVEEGWPGLQEALASDDADTVAAAVAAYAIAGNPARLIAAWDNLTPVAVTGHVRGLSYVKLPPGIEAALRTALTNGSTSAQAVGAQTLAAHGKLSGGDLKAIRPAEDTTVTRACAQAAGHLEADPEWLGFLADHEDAEIREASLLAMLRRGLPAAVERTRRLAAGDATASPAVLGLLAAVGDDRDLDAFRRHCEREDLAEAALAGLGTVGTALAVEELLALMDRGELARGAGAAFHRITGMTPPAARHEPKTTEEEDATFEDLRPVPDAEATRSAWRSAAPRFENGRRYRGGEALDTERWRKNAHLGDLATRREELLRLWSSGAKIWAGLDVDAAAKVQQAQTRAGG